MGGLLSSDLSSIDSDEDNYEVENIEDLQKVTLLVQQKARLEDAYKNDSNGNLKKKKKKKKGKEKKNIKIKPH